MATPRETRVLEAAKFWYQVLVQADVLETYERELFVAVAELLNPPAPDLTVEDNVDDSYLSEMPTIPVPKIT